MKNLKKFEKFEKKIDFLKNLKILIDFLTFLKNFNSDSRHTHHANIGDSRHTLTWEQNEGMGPPYILLWHHPTYYWRKHFSAGCQAEARPNTWLSRTTFSLPEKPPNWLTWKCRVSNKSGVYLEIWLIIRKTNIAIVVAVLENPPDNIFSPIDLTFKIAGLY